MSFHLSKVTHSIDKAFRPSQVLRTVAAPIVSAVKADPIANKIRTGHFSWTKPVDAGLHELYKGDPVGNQLLTEKDATNTAKVAGAVAATYFTLGAASALGGTATGSALLGGAKVVGALGGLALTAQALAKHQPELQTVSPVSGVRVIPLNQPANTIGATPTDQQKTTQALNAPAQSPSDNMGLYLVAIIAGLVILKGHF